MSYRKWSVPDDAAADIDKACRELGWTKRRDRWALLITLSHYARVHSDLFRKR